MKLIDRIGALETCAGTAPESPAIVNLDDADAMKQWATIKAQYPATHEPVFFRYDDGEAQA
jgi:hypothetical protein